MDKQDVVDLDHGIAPAQPASVDAIGLHRRLKLFPTAKTLDVLRPEITVVAGQDHRLVVSKQHMHAPARLLRLRLEGHQQVERLAGFGSAPENIARLHEVGLAADPLIALVHYLRVAQTSSQLLIIAVDIADGHNAFDIFPGETPFQRKYRRRMNPRRHQDEAEQESA